MDYPKSITTETGDVLEITGYENGKFIIGNSPTIVSYRIEVNQFQTLSPSGIEVPFGIKAKNHEFYLEWLKKISNSPD